MFRSITAAPLPADALLQRFVAEGHYTDCFTTTASRSVSLPEFVEAFYTSWLFKTERVILDALASLPSTDDEARQVANGERDSFAAWDVEDRSADQLLLIDFRKRTGSWFKLEGMDEGSRLYFGSVVFKTEQTSSGMQMEWTYRLLLGFHRLYSRALLSAARSRLLSVADRE